MSAPTEPLVGACFCGRVRVRFEGERRVTICHCTICQRLSGCEYQTFLMTMSHERLRVTAGAEHLRTVRSSDAMERQFCGVCGSSVLNKALTFPMRDAPLTIFERDAAGRLRERGEQAVHIYYLDRVRNHIDGLPKFAELPIGAEPLTVDAAGDVFEPTKPSESDEPAKKQRTDPEPTD